MMKGELGVSAALSGWECVVAAEDWERKELVEE